MHGKNVVKLAAVLLLAGLVWAARGEGAVLPADVKAVWDMDKAWRETTPTRERICINGLWRWQPADEQKLNQPPTENWGYFKVPGAWPNIKVHQWMAEDSQSVYFHPEWKDAKQAPITNLVNVTMAWYEREFKVPGQWKGRRMALNVDWLGSCAAVFVDGKKTAEIYYPGGEIDITAACRPGEKQVLSILVATAPKGQKLADYLATPPVKRGDIGSYRGLCGDVYLCSTPVAERLTDIKVNTSVRKWEIELDVAVAELAAGQSYQINGRVLDGTREAKKLDAKTFTAADLVNGRLRFATAWHPEKLWDTITPENQYTLECALADGKGKVVDAWPALRFGFREMWFDGRDCRLNGTRFYWYAMPLDNANRGPSASTYEVAKESFLRAKKSGYNLLYTHNYAPDPGVTVGFGEILRAADDTGMLVSFAVPGTYTYKGFPWPYNKITPESLTNGYPQHLEYYVRSAQNHPAVVVWFSFESSGGPQDQNPDHLAEAEKAPPVGGQLLTLKMEEMVNRLDGTRPIYHHAGGNNAQMHTMNCYLNFAPIQERSEWFGHWATTAHKPVFPAEYGLPFNTTFLNSREGWNIFGSKMAMELCSVEWGAQFRGDAANDVSDEEKANLRFEAGNWKAKAAFSKGAYPFFDTSSFPNMQDVLAMHVADNWPAFRTWGVTGYNVWEQQMFWHPRAGMDRSVVAHRTDWETLQRPGYSPDFSQRRAFYHLDGKASDWEPDATGRAMIRYSNPLLAYIAGKPERFTSKDHNFLPGETFEKQIIVLNNSRRPVTCDVAWALGLPAAIKGEQKLSVETGEQGRTTLRLAIPAGTKPGRYLLTLTAKYSTGERQEDAFAIDVLPVPEKTKVTGKVALFDPRGETAKLLETMGVKAELVKADADLTGYDLLIIGKKALTPFGAAPDITRVRDGLKVLVFEQTQEALEKRLGFRTQEYGLRQVFSRATNHPVLEGLTPEELRNWCGEATILPPRIESVYNPQLATTGIRAGLRTDRVWRCGCYGNVASVLIEKPACGDFLPLVDGGFALQFSPLMEYREGRGMVLFCQMDVTGRTQADPAATCIAHNILQYASSWKPTARRTALYVGDAAGKAHLERSGLMLTDYAGGALATDQVLIVGAGGGQKLTGQKPAIAKWLQSGGNLLAITLEQDEANAFLPSPIRTKKAEHIAAAVPLMKSDSLFAGVAPADVYTRDAAEIALITDGATPVGDGILAQAKGLNVVFCQVAPWRYNYMASNGNAWQLENKDHYIKWTYQRTSSLLARLLGNMGVGASTPLLTRFGKPAVDGDSLQDLVDAPWIEGAGKELVLPTRWKGLAVSAASKKPEPAGWEAAGFDDGIWRQVRLPGFWGEQFQDSLEVAGGSTWYHRLKINVPADMAAEELTLMLGKVEVNDWAYVNGKLIGHTEGRATARKYKIPAGSLKAGENLLALKIFANSPGAGGVMPMNDPRQKLRLEDAGKYLPLESVRYYRGLYLDDPSRVDDVYRYFRW